MSQLGPLGKGETFAYDKAPIRVEELTLHTMWLGMAIGMSPEFLSEIKFHDDAITGYLRMIWHGRQYYLKGDVLEVPLTWWDHAKQRLKANRKVPAWLKRRVKEIRVAQHEAIAMIPDMPVARRVVKYELFPSFHQINRHAYDSPETCDE